MPAHIYVDRISGLDELIGRLNEHPAKAREVMRTVVNKLAAEVLRNAKQNLIAHRKTGGTIQAAQMRTNAADISATIGAFNLIGLFIEKGTKAHAIAARNARALMLPVSASPRAGTGGTFSRDFGTQMNRGRKTMYSPHYRATGSLRAGRGGTGAQVAFFKSVHHPGNKPYPWLAPALPQSAPVRDMLLKLAGEDITAFLAGRAL